MLIKSDTAIATTAVYEELYATGYMDEWPAAKKQRVFELVRSLGLPATGMALDFGCGNGVFTRVLKAALPGWRVYGTDLSTTALNTAKARCPDCIFERDLPTMTQFDFVFSHHVLEHVDDLAWTMHDLASRTLLGGHTLHILPCGNPGSLEFQLAKKRPNGIDHARGRRWYFEDPTHNRRLRSQELEDLMFARGFDLEREWYSNHFWGAVNWITRSSLAFIDVMVDGAWPRLRAALLSAALLRRPAVAWQGIRSKAIWSLRDMALLAVGLPFYLLARPLDVWFQGKADNEWRTRNHERSGSEMYLYFRKAE